MTHIMPDATAHPNASTIEGLREVADWLEAHPELPKVGYAHVVVVSRYMTRGPGEAREQLTALARAFGDGATERRLGGDVQIESRQFGAVRVYGSVAVSELVDAPPPPADYEPILPTPTGARNIARGTGHP